MLVYHGTGFSKARMIAESGFILSPLELEIEMIREQLKASRNDSIGPSSLDKDYSQLLSYTFSGRLDDQKIEEVAISILSQTFSSAELSLRIRKPSLTTSMNEAKDNAQRFVEQGGVILCLNQDDCYMELYNSRDPRQIWHNHQSKLRASLSNLKTVFILPPSNTSAESYQIPETLNNALTKYSPRIEYI